MQCYICGHVLSGEQVSYNNEHKDWDPCPTCLIAIAEVFSDPLDEEQVTYVLEKEGILEKDEQPALILVDKSD